VVKIKQPVQNMFFFYGLFFASLGDREKKQRAPGTDGGENCKALKALPFNTSCCMLLLMEESDAGRGAEKALCM